MLKSGSHDKALCSIDSPPPPPISSLVGTTTMEPEKKKRKYEVEGDIRAPTGATEHDPLAGFGVNEILKAVCKNRSSRENALNVFIDALGRATPEDVRSAKNLLRPFLLSTFEARHCVRCHQSYLESDNSAESCKVGHVGIKDVEDEIVWRGSFREQLMEYTCCNEQLTEGEANEKAICYEERHTENPWEVEYTDEDEYAGCETTFEDNFVVKCRDAGCPGASDSEDDEDESDDGIIEISS